MKDVQLSHRKQPIRKKAPMPLQYITQVVVMNTTPVNVTIFILLTLLYM